MLEAKARDQGHNAKVFPPTPEKRSSFQKVEFFSAKLRRSLKKFFAQKFASSLMCSKTKQHCSRPWPIFNHSKNSTVLESRTGYFRGLAGFEAKNLTFKAKVKDSNCVLEAKDVLEYSTSDIYPPRYPYLYEEATVALLFCTILPRLLRSLPHPL